MSTYLYRLGRFAFRRRWLVTGFWVGLLALMSIGATALAEGTTDSFDIPGTESMEALELLEERFPEAAADGATARVVFLAPPGETLTDPDNQAAISDTLGELAQIPDVVSVADPFQAQLVSPDGTAAIAQVDFGVALPAANQELTAAVAPAQDAGLTVELGGEALMQEFEQGAADLIGLAVAALVLIVTFGSFVAAGLPLLNAIIGIGVTLGAVTAATSFVNVSSFTPTLAMMLGLALAIDYSLFIVSRYRHERSTGLDGQEAIGRALGTAGSAVVFAGLTVVIALAGLSVVGVPILREMGLAAALAVTLSVLIALTMVPAMCGFAGRLILGGRIPGLRARDPEADDVDDVRGKPSLGTRWVRLVTSRPVPVLVIAGLVMLTLAIPAMSLRLGLPDEGSMPEDTTQRRAYDLIAEKFGPGLNGPLMVVVDASGGADVQAASQQVIAAVGELDGVALAGPEPRVNQAGDTALVTIIPTTGPSDIETEDLVGEIRDRTGQVESDTGAEVSVSGSTAIIIDFTGKLGAALLPYLGLVVGLSFLLLMLVFRSVLVPLKAALGFLLTVGATFGAVVAVFQWGWAADLLAVEQTNMIISFLPIFLIGVVFGLAMDYQVFLVTRMREEHVHGAAPIPAIVTGFQHSSRVVTAAAIIMISVFAGFALSGDDFIMQVAFALATAIALDAFVVRMTLVPAVLALLKRSAWWLPRWLDRLLPNVDVEGDKLRVAREATTAVAARTPEPASAGGR
ncbi:MAG: MMPL family transporter [Micromonosporaceae bacterium]|nr:MMPL family transporter [Micromonosporaceae bacterium]